MSSTTLRPRSCARGREPTEIGDVAEVRIELREVLRPVAVIRIDVGVGLDVLHDRRDPERGDTELLHVVEMLGQSAPVAALKAREVTGTNLVIVVVIAIGKAVDEDLIDYLVRASLQRAWRASAGRHHRARSRIRLGSDAGRKRDRDRRGRRRAYLSQIAMRRTSWRPPLDHKLDSTDTKSSIHEYEVIDSRIGRRIEPPLSAPIPAKCSTLR